MFDLFESLEIAVEPIAVALFIVGLGLTASVPSHKSRPIQ